MDRARKIALKHSQQLVDFANAVVEKEQARHQALQNKPSKVGPPAGTWAATARMMAQGDNSGFDWDAWKDQMKERSV